MTHIPHALSLISASLRPALRRQALFVLGTSLALSAVAQTTTADTPPPPPAKDAALLDAVSVTGRRIDTYTVNDTASATKLTLSPRETPQSMTVITRERLDDQGLTSLRAVLDNTPGIYSNAYDTERVLFYSRGFLVDALMYDGVPAHTNFSTGSIDETLDTALYERIEVVRGATGLMTGAGSPAASINVVRKHADSKVPTFSFNATAGSWQNFRAEADATFPLTSDGRIRARVVAVGEDRESFQDLYHKKTSVFSGIVDADLAPSTRLSVGFDYQDNRPKGNTWGSFPLFLSDGTPANWPRSVTTATNWSYWNRKTQTAFGELRHTFDNGWTLRSTLSQRRYTEDVSLFYVDLYPDPVTGAGLDPYAYRSKGKINEVALDAYASGPFQLLGRKHELVLGYNGARTKNTGTEFEPVPEDMVPIDNFFQWDGSYPQPRFQAGTPLNDIKTRQDGLYAAARFSLADSLKLIAGARYVRWNIDSFYVYDTPVNSKFDYRKVIPYTGVVWDFHPQFSAFASYTSIFKPQNERDIDGRYLDPIQGRSFELGFKGEHFDRKLNTAFTVFETRQDNVAGPVYDPITGAPLTRADGSAITQPIDGTRTRGFEIEASGRLAPNWQGSFGWTRYITKDGDDQQIRTYIPSTLVRLFATWEPKGLVDGLSLGGGLNWQSQSSTAVGSPGGGELLRQPSVTQLSLMARYQLTPVASLQFNGNNLLDKKYYVLDQFNNTYYGTPANYSLTLRLAY